MVNATQTIDSLCFEKDGVLYNEFNQLYQALFDSPDKHLLIINTLATKRKGLTRLEILQTTGLPNAGSLTRILEELEESSFIEKYMPISQKITDNLYRLTDYYSLFYLKYIQNNKTKKSVFITMITSYGIVQNKYSIGLVQNDINLNALFERN